MRRAHRNTDLAASASRAVLAAAALLCAQCSFAQSKDVPPPPLLDAAPLVFTITPKELADKPPDPSRLSASQLASATAPARPPNAAMLAPAPEGRSTPIDEILVIGPNSNLPDLGSRWRARQQAAEDDAKGRAHLTILPLYDPEHPTTFDSLGAPPEMQRMGYIDLFRVRFGHRAKSDE